MLSKKKIKVFSTHLDADQECTIKEVCRAAISDSGLNYDKVAEMMGAKNKSNIAMAMRTKNYETLVSILDVCGYDICLWKREDNGVMRGE